MVETVGDMDMQDRGELLLVGRLEWTLGWRGLQAAELETIEEAIKTPPVKV